MTLINHITYIPHYQSNFGYMLSEELVVRFNDTNVFYRGMVAVQDLIVYCSSGTVYGIMGYHYPQGHSTHP